MDQDNPFVASTDAVVLRSLIREELFQGLRSLQCELQESFRQLLCEQSARGDVVVPSPGEMKIDLTGDLCLRQAATETSGGGLPVLPGAVEHEEELEDVSPPVRDGTPSSIKDRPSGGSGVRPKLKQKDGYKCSCGNVFVDDALFCRKCGEQRANACVCGNILKEDAVFCRKCGRTREIAAAKLTEKRDITSRKAADKRKSKKSDLFKSLDPVEQTKLQRIVTHKFWETCSGSLIVANALFLGYQTNYSAKMYHEGALEGRERGELPGSFFVFQCIFCFCFTWELGLRWAAEGLIAFFLGEDVCWNSLDVIVVTTSLLEVAMELVAQATSTQKTDALSNVSIIRVLRIVRIVRVARVIRVMRFFRELRMMIFSILGCLKNLVWVLVVLLMTFFAFGIVFTTAACDALDTNEKWLSEDNAGLVESFGTIDKSILSLFMSMSGGNDWSQYYDALTHLPAYCRLAFLFFITFCIFAVVNIVTGVFVESALQANIKDKDILVHEELHNKQEYVKSMRELFEEIDNDGEGTISLAEFEGKLADSRVMAYFNAMKLDVTDARTVFLLLDSDHSDEVGIEEFLEGIYKLQGESRSLDVKIMQCEVHYLQEHMDKFRVEIVAIKDLLTSLTANKSVETTPVARNGVSNGSISWTKFPPASSPAPITSDEVEDV